MSAFLFNKVYPALFLCSNCALCITEYKSYFLNAMDKNKNKAVKCITIIIHDTSYSTFTSRESAEEEKMAEGLYNDTRTFRAT